MRSQTPIVYTPESPLRRPGLFAQSMWQDLCASRGLAWRLFVRDISAQYRQSILGYLWVFIPPLIAGLPFIFMNAHGIARFAPTPIPYPAFALIGTALWQMFVDALNAPLRSALAAKAVLVRINLPREAILLSAFAQAVFNALARLPLIGAVMLLYGIAPPGTALLFPINS